MARTLLGISPTTLCPTGHTEALRAKPGLRSSVPQMSSISAPGQAPSTASLNPQTQAQGDPPAPPPAHCTRAGGEGRWGSHPSRFTLSDANQTEPKESGCLIEKKIKGTGRAPTVARCGVWLCPIPHLSESCPLQAHQPAQHSSPSAPRRQFTLPERAQRPVLSRAGAPRALPFQVRPCGVWRVGGG